MPPENNQNLNNQISPQVENKSTGLNTILLILLVALVGFGIWFLSQKKEVVDKDVPIETQENTEEQNTTNEELDSESSYSNTPESKVTKEESVAYITNFEKSLDGYYYFSLDYVVFDFSQPGPAKLINDNTKIRKFRVSPTIKIVRNYKDYDLGDGDQSHYVSLENYLLMLQKKNEFYYNPDIQEGSFQNNGLFQVYIENGLVIEINEIGDLTEAQGT